MQERPDELAADVLERELEVRVLERRVVPGEVDVACERIAPGAAALLLDRVGERVTTDLLGGDDSLRAVAGARGGGDAVERSREGVHEPHAGRRREERRHAERV